MKKTRRKPISTDRTLAYAQDVVDGKVIAGPHVRNACRRHIDDLKRTDGIRFDLDAAERAIGFFETVLKLSDGQFDGKPFTLHPSQAFIIGSLFGWKRADGTRRFHRAYIEQGKGNGKTPLSAGIALYGLVGCGESGAEIYSAASKREQASVMFRDAVRMIQKSKPLSSRLDMSGGAGKEYNIAYLKRGSFFRMASRDTGKTGSGPRPYFVLADEVHEMLDRTILETLERGFKFRQEPLLVMTTNSAASRTCVAREEHEHAIRCAAGNHDAVTDPTYLGEIVADNTFSYVCALDPGDDPLTDESCWEKANPLLGVTISRKYLADVVAQAKAIPGQLNGILRLHFCVWTDSSVAWMARATLEPRICDFQPVRGAKTWLGLDLSQVRDITALAAVQQNGFKHGKPCFDAWVEAWTPGDTVSARSLRDKLPYDLWVAGGHLNAPPGENISFRDVAQALHGMNSEYSIEAVAYDRYAFRRFEQEAAEIGLALNYIEHPQGGTKRGKPHDGMAEGLWMPGSLRHLEELILEGRIRIKRNLVLVSAMMSAVLERDRWDNCWLSKQKSSNKIDCAVALCMAVGAAMAGATQKQSVYERRGVLVI